MKLVGFLLLFPLFLAAQDDPNLYYDLDTVSTAVPQEPVELPKWEWTANFSGQLPRNVFQLYSTKTFYFGGNTGFQRYLSKVPVILGSTIGFYDFGAAALSYDGSIGDEIGEIRERSHSWTINLQVYGRYLLPYWKNFQPYADVFVQPNFYLLTNSFRDVEFDETISSEVAQSGFGIGFGGAVGLLIYFPKADMLQLNLRFAYHRSTTAEYSVYDGDFSSSTLEAFTPRSSQVNALVPEIGLVVPMW